MMTEQDRLRLQDYLDGRLDEASKAEVEAQLSASEEWRDELEFLRISREVSRSGLNKIKMPDGLKQQIQTAVQAELSGETQAKKTGRLIPFRVQLGAVAATLMITLGLFVLVPQPVAEPVATVSAIFEVYQGGNREMQFTPEDPTCIEEHLAKLGMTFDLSMVELEGFRYTGGCITKTDNNEYATFAYYNEKKRLVTCQMFPGSLKTLAGTYEHRIQRGKDFLIARKNGLTMTFWQDGDMVCVLSTKGDEDSAIQLAVNKATEGKDLS